MDRYINAGSLLTKIKAYRPYMYLGEDALSYAIKMVELEPSADVRENVKGKWLQDKHDEAGYGYFDCSVCGADFYDVYDFCPNCGADMRADMRGEA